MTVRLSGTVVLKLPALTWTFILKLPTGVPPLLFGGPVRLALVQPEMPASATARSSPAE